MMHVVGRCQKKTGAAPLEKVDSMADKMVGVKRFVVLLGVIEAAGGVAISEV